MYIQYCLSDAHILFVTWYWHLYIVCYNNMFLVACQISMYRMFRGSQLRVYAHQLFCDMARLWHSGMVTMGICGWTSLEGSNVQIVEGPKIQPRIFWGCTCHLCPPDVRSGFVMLCHHIWKQFGHWNNEFRCIQMLQMQFPWYLESCKDFHMYTLCTACFGKPFQEPK